ncbi:MAG: hydroxyisourate hydrolase [Acidobacteriota bacterium]
MGAITTHVLDTARGRPAAGVPIVLRLREDDGSWVEVSRGSTDTDGRLRTLTAEHPLRAATYSLTFDTAAYSGSLGGEAFFPEVSITFEVIDPEQHYHVPLLLSPFGYSTYRGS